MLDAICWKYYGRRDETVEKVLEANPDLAKQGAVLPSGLLITLPDLPAPQKQSIRLWD